MATLGTTCSIPNHSATFPIVFKIVRIQLIFTSIIFKICYQRRRRSAAYRKLQYKLAKLFYSASVAADESMDFFGKQPRADKTHPAAPIRHDERPIADETKTFEWTCTVCTFLNPPILAVCGMCASDPAIVNADAVDDDATAAAAWECYFCTLQNEPNCTICAVCAKTRIDLFPEAAHSNDGGMSLYAQLNAQLQQLGGLVRNTDPIECPICLATIEPGHGVVLTDCLHAYCRACLTATIRHSDRAEVDCPMRDAQGNGCDGRVMDSEIRTLLNGREYQNRVQLSMRQAEANEPKAFHCKTPNCVGWCVNDDDGRANEFECDVCAVVNCTRCDVSIATMVMWMMEVFIYVYSD